MATQEKEVKIMFKELHYYFNATAFNKLVYDAGYDGIKDFAERSGIPISYKTIKRACNNGHCTKRTYYAVACELARTLEWEDPIAELKTAFNKKIEYDGECLKNHCGVPEELRPKYEEVVVCLTNDHVVSVKGKSIYWSWFDSDKTICFYDEEAYDGEDLKIAEFNKATVMGIIRRLEE